ncbi:hypothetical protein AMS59_10470 [Lysinibacillus sp. FJAT-14745]|nr:hypothetical protein AMS59_10470 [Lysinibacillus sp. FJAT-14745]
MIRIESKKNGLTLIFLYQFSGNEFYKDYYDFSIAFHLDEGSVTFASEVLNKKISEGKIKELLEGFTQIF